LASAAPAGKKGRGKASASTPSREDALALLDVPTLDALRASRSPFLAGTSPPLPNALASARVVAAVEILATNPRLDVFGVDGTGVELDAAAATAVGSVVVASLVFPLELRLSAEARDAFLLAVGSNATLRSLSLSCTNVDAAGEEGFDVVDAWSADGSPFVRRVQELRRARDLPALEVLGDDSFAPDVAGEEGEESGEEGEEGDDDDDEPCVQCDRKGCRRELTGPDEAVFTNKFGQDFCRACAEAMGPRPDLRQTTVAARLAEVLGDSSGA